MRARPFLIGVLSAAILMPSTVMAQQQAAARHIADVAMLRAQASHKAAADREHRRLIGEVLDRSEIRAVADRMGLDITRAKAAVAVTDGEALADLAGLARTARTDLAGGNTVITISVTTLLLALILLVLLID